MQATRFEVDGLRQWPTVLLLLKAAMAAAALLAAVTLQTRHDKSQEMFEE
jgi:hypothetical protein